MTPFCVILLIGCESVTKTDNCHCPDLSIYADSGYPGIIYDTDNATQKDVARAYLETYKAWEKCADNLSFAVNSD